MEPIVIQLLSSLPLLNYFAHFYRQVIGQADTRTASWAFMGSFDIPVSVVLLYLFTVVVLGPSLMRRITIPQVNRVLIVYNSFVLVLNLWLGISLTWHIYKAGYELGCQRVSRVGTHEKSIASLLWIFHCSKIIELVDTLFHVLKKKKNQLTFLHLYHHSTIVVATWIGVRFVPGGSSAVIAMVNSWIHVFMYFYYEMMVLRVKSFRNYKKIVTILQIVQFLATIVLCTTALKRDCGYPKWILTWLLLYMISFLVLFLHFYVQTYWTPKGGEGKGTPSSEDEQRVRVRAEAVNSAFSDEEGEEEQEESDDKEDNNGGEGETPEISSNNRGSSSSDSNGEFGDMGEWEKLEDSESLGSSEASEEEDLGSS